MTDVPSGWMGERHCAKCQPRPHRVLMNFQQHNVWDLSFLESDCKTVIGRRFDVPTDQELFALAERGGADLEELRQSIARWNKGFSLAEPYRAAVSAIAATEGEGKAVVSVLNGPPMREVICSCLLACTGLGEPGPKDRL